MARIATTVNTNESASVDSGAFHMDKTLANNVGTGILVGAAGGSAAIGLIVAPLPVLGAASIGAGVLAAANFHEIKSYFASEDAPMPLINDDYDHTAGVSVEPEVI